MIIREIRSFSVFLFSVISVALLGQLPANVVGIEGNVIELTSDSEYHLVNEVPFTINDKIEFTSDDKGNFNVVIPFESDRLNLQVNIPDYEIIQPRNGRHLFEAFIEPNKKYTLLIVIVSANLDESLKREIVEAQSQIDQLKSQNIYSEIQLQKLNKSYLDSIQTYKHKEIEYAHRLSQLRDSLTYSSDEIIENNASINELSRKLEANTEYSENLFIKLKEAMEERYLKQKSTYQSFSSNLRMYVSRVKDVALHLDIISDLIKSGNTDNYNESLNAYSESYEELVSNRDDVVNSVAHYWESDVLAEMCDSLINEILVTVHKDEMLKLNEGINHELQRASSGKRLKLRRVKDQAYRSSLAINDKMLYIETNIASILEVLGKF